MVLGASGADNFWSLLKSAGCNIARASARLAATHQIRAPSPLAIATAPRTMRWPGWSSERKDVSETSSPPPPPSPPPPKPVSWNESLNKMDWQHFKEPSNWIPSLLVTATALGLLRFYRSYLRRIPGTDHIKPTFFRRRSLFGRVTSVGDGDNFHMFHTPGGRLAGWGWLRRVPTERKELKGRTVSTSLPRTTLPWPRLC